MRHRHRRSKYLQAVLISVGAVVVSFNACTGGQGAFVTQGASLAEDAPLATDAPFVLAGKNLSADYTLAADAGFKIFNVTRGAERTIYVDADAGVDTAAGTNAAPLRSIAAAIAFAARANAQKPADTAIVLRGEFHLAQPLAFDATNAGQGGKFLTLVGDTAKPAVLSGGTVLANAWVLDDATNNIYSLSVPAGVHSRNLFLNGKRLAIAKSAYPLAATLRPDTSYDCAGCGLPVAPADAHVEAVLSYQWQSHRCPATVSPAGLITLEAACRALVTSRAYAVPTTVTWIEGAKHLITRGGQWARDDAGGKIYYKPLAGESMQTGRFVASSLENIVTLNGANNVAFVGLTFRDSNWLKPFDAEGAVNLQADIFSTRSGVTRIPAAVDCTGCQNVLVMDSVFTALGGAAVRLGVSSQRNLLFHNRFDDIGASAIQIGEESPSTSVDFVKQNTIEDNEIRRAGAENLSSPGIFQWYAAESLIRQNTLTDLPYTGISVGWGWTPSASPNSYGNVIARNFVQNVTQAMQDGGGIYLLSNQPGTQVTENFIQDMRSGWPRIHATAFSNGIYLDNGSSNMLVRSNVVENALTYDLFQQNIVEPFATNNTVDTAGASPAVVRASAGNRIPFPSVTPIIEFGGMFGYDWDPVANAPSYRANPLTGRDTCPADFRAVRVLGTMNVDWDLWYCYRPLGANETPAADFGGLYSGGVDGNGSTVNFANPRTGANSCPAGFNSYQALGSPGTDANLFYCLRTHVAGAANFAGIWGNGTMTAFTPHPIVYANPLTATSSCPAGTTQTQALGIANLDWGVFGCY